jgi:catechol 2,3-dioxygenase-like lactoylglutathione lyase family enzyme
VSAADDQLELRRLLDVYAAAVDDRDGAAMAALFVADGRLLVYEADTGELSHAYRGRAELAQVAAEMERFYVRTFHFVGNFVCDLDGDRATGTPYCVAHHLRDDGRGPQVLVMPVRYRDAYVRTPDGWRFEERVCTVLWRERRPAVQWPPPIDDQGPAPQGP